MNILYAYNEILPKKSAHDVYIAKNCTALAAAGAQLTFAFGAGSLSNKELSRHYQVDFESLVCRRLPIVRRNYGLPVNMNVVFFWSAQREIARTKPDWVAASVIKQGAYHLKRKIAGVKYVYEVHELAWYPDRTITKEIEKNLEVERNVFNAAEAITVTTTALKDILQSSLYRIKTPIAVIPLAVDSSPLPPPPVPGEAVEIMYVGQFYQGQGLDLLLAALSKTTDIHLTLIGGKPAEIDRLQQLSQSLDIEKRVLFTGFIPPGQLPAIVSRCHAFVAPFSAVGKMPYVAHTKLLEYSAWQRPVIAPDLPATSELYVSGNGWVPYTADDPESLAVALQSLTDETYLAGQAAGSRLHKPLSWNERSTRYLDFLSSI